MITIQAARQDPKPYYRRLLADNGLVEIRHKVGGRWLSYWFDSETALFAFLRANFHAGDLYSSLNAPKLRAVRNGETVQEPLTNDGVAWITRIPFDFDPERAAGTAATDAQLALAFDVRQALLDLVQPMDWGLPLCSMSGNGYHAQYRTRLPNNVEVREMLDVIYRGLRGDLPVDRVNFDISVRNPGRIFRAYGTINRKGGGNRVSTVWIPPRWDQLRIGKIAELAEYYARTTPEVTREHRRTSAPMVTGKGDYRTLDVAAWFQAHGLYLAQVEPDKHAVTCPFADAHTTPTKPKDTVVWDGGEAWPTFHCSHAHCADRTIRDVMALWGDADRFCAADYGEAS